MNIINAIRRNWLWLTLCLLLFTISGSRNFGHHPLSWWNACWILLPFFLAAYAGNNSWIIFQPLRWLTWINLREHMEKKVKSLTDNIMAYPAILWLNLGDAERAYITGGAAALDKAFDAQIEKTKNALTAAFTQVAKKPERDACDCHNPACDCAVAI